MTHDPPVLATLTDTLFDLAGTAAIIIFAFCIAAYFLYRLLGSRDDTETRRKRLDDGLERERKRRWDEANKRRRK